MLHINFNKPQNYINLLLILNKSYHSFPNRHIPENMSMDAHMRSLNTVVLVHLDSFLLQNIPYSISCSVCSHGFKIFCLLIAMLKLRDLVPFCSLSEATKRFHLHLYYTRILSQPDWNIWLTEKRGFLHKFIHSAHS